jgi:hypothetical protein
MKKLLTFAFLILVLLTCTGNAATTWNGFFWYGPKADWSSPSVVRIPGTFTNTLNSDVPAIVVALDTTDPEKQWEIPAIFAGASPMIRADLSENDLDWDPGYGFFQAATTNFTTLGTFYGGFVMTNAAGVKIEWGRGKLTVFQSAGLGTAAAFTTGQTVYWDLIGAYSGTWPFTVTYSSADTNSAAGTGSTTGYAISIVFDTNVTDSASVTNASWAASNGFAWSKSGRILTGTYPTNNSFFTNTAGYTTHTTNNLVATNNPVFVASLTNGALVAGDAWAESIADRIWTITFPTNNTAFTNAAGYTTHTTNNLVATNNTAFLYLIDRSNAWDTAADTAENAILMPDGFFGGGTTKGRIQYNDNAIDNMQIRSSNFRIGEATPGTATGLGDAFVSTNLEVKGVSYLTGGVGVELKMLGNDIEQGPSNTLFNTGNLNGTNGAYWVVGSTTNWLLFE